MIAHYAAMLNPRYRYRSSVSGEFVTRAYAFLHPRETERERVQ